MQEILTVMTRKGQITVPAKIREMLDLQRGDKLALTVTDLEKGEVTMRRVQSVADATYGAVTVADPSVSDRGLREQAMIDVAANAGGEGRDSAGT